MKIEKWLSYLVFGVAVATLVILITGFAGAAPQNTSGVGYIDMERVQNELPDFIKLKELVKDKNQELEFYQGYLYKQHQSNLKALQEKAAEEKKGKSSEEQGAIDKRYNEEVQKKIDEVKAQMQKKAADADKEVSAEKKLVYERLRSTIAGVANEQKLTMVFEKNTLFFGGTDITQQVIEKGKKAAPAPVKK